jgi:hypothetical protein
MKSSGVKRGGKQKQREERRREKQGEEGGRRNILMYMIYSGKNIKNAYRRRQERGSREAHV